jgi:diguanylate cyclase (GGDEF)-like protein
VTPEAILQRRVQREREGRLEAERLLEEKSLELYEINQGLRNWTAMLEEIVKERTAELTKALEETHQAKSQIEHQALHDPLTGLANRRYLSLILEELTQSKDKEGGLAIFHIDLDRFKQINDTRGHAAGDYVIAHTAAVLNSLIRSEDFVARIGGDEFVIVARSDGDTKALAALATRIITELAKPVLYKKGYCRFGASIGIAYALLADADPAKMLVNADIALYRAKDSGRGRYAFFSGHLQREIVEKQNTAEDILNGLDRSEFFPVYQPQFDAKTYKVIGVETLVRWNHPERGILAPSQFIKIAEDIKAINRIDSFMLERSLRDILSFRDAGIDIPRLSVNMSLRRLCDPQLIKSLEEWQIPEGLLSFELVESIFLDEGDSDASISRAIKSLKRLGIDIEIDDFGTGHASILGLLRVRPARLKIDQQLVKPVVRSGKQRRLLQSIIEMGKALGIGIVAEGVESMEHAEIMRDLGCDILQGFALAVPMTAPRLFHFLKTGGHRRDGEAPSSAGGESHKGAGAGAPSLGAKASS